VQNVLYATGSSSTGFDNVNPCSKGNSPSRESKSTKKRRSFLLGLNSVTLRLRFSTKLDRSFIVTQRSIQIHWNTFTALIDQTEIDESVTDFASRCFFVQLA
jgi:hypothetical protein